MVGLRRLCPSPLIYSWPNPDRSDLFLGQCLTEIRNGVGTLVTGVDPLAGSRTTGRGARRFPVLLRKAHSASLTENTGSLQSGKGGPAPTAVIANVLRPAPSVLYNRLILIPAFCSANSRPILLGPVAGIGSGLVKHALRRCVTAASLIGGRALVFKPLM